MAYRASKSGIAADIQKKMEAKMDELEAEGITGYIVSWINAVLSGDADAEAIPGTKASDIHDALMDGVRLLKLINAIRAHRGESALKIEHSKSKIPSMAAAKHMDNLGRFLKGAESLGMKVNDLFQSADLYEGSRAQMVNVVNSLHSFGLLSKSLHFEPTYTGPGQYATENVRGFTEEEVRQQSASIVSKQISGSHGHASQAGMRAPGTSRHIAD
ncbi:transgelin-3-like [Sycon ciliatum]|uniref:transgelin-3-like n=1 Tax=Sycon ciliatum TaxID=27933 RepID=UPI0031F70422|eukprot:scpid82208/ scgid26399/ Transgelin-3; Neuronal protein 22; Neuronal protein NP25 &gt; Transgelin-3